MCSGEEIVKQDAIGQPIARYRGGVDVIEVVLSSMVVQGG